MYSVLYTSTAAAPFDTPALEALLSQSREANTRRGITGLLLYRAGRFIQFLEGPEPAVRALLAQIAEDARHENVRVLLDGRTSQRQFPEWTMGYDSPAVPSGPLPPGFRDTFEDLDDADGDRDVVIRAARELSHWFRIRATR